MNSNLYIFDNYDLQEETLKLLSDFNYIDQA